LQTSSCPCLSQRNEDVFTLAFAMLLLKSFSFQVGSDLKGGVRTNKIVNQVFKRANLLSRPFKSLSTWKVN